MNGNRNTVERLIKYDFLLHSFEDPFAVFLESVSKLNLSYFACLEAQHVDPNITFGGFWEAPGGSVALCPWDLGGSGHLLGT